MALQYDINRIFAELEQQARKKSKKHEKVDRTSSGTGHGSWFGCMHG